MLRVCRRRPRFLMGSSPSPAHPYGGERRGRRGRPGAKRRSRQPWPTRRRSERAPLRSARAADAARQGRTPGRRSRPDKRHTHGYAAPMSEEHHTPPAATEPEPQPQSNSGGSTPADRVAAILESLRAEMTASLERLMAARDAEQHHRAAADAASKAYRAEWRAIQARGLLTPAQLRDAGFRRPGPNLTPRSPGTRAAPK